MDLSKIILIVVIILLIYAIVQIIRNRNTYSTFLPGVQGSIIPSNSLSTGIIPNSSNSSYSIWIFVDNWNYRLGETKYILVRGKVLTSGETFEAAPVISLDQFENNLIVETSYHKSMSGNDSTSSSSNLGKHTCKVTNIPIQKWVNILVSTSGRTMDIYIDGKLVNTCLLPGTAAVVDEDIFITPDGGFSGYTSKFQYYSNSSTSEDAWAIYQEGFEQSWFQNLLNTRINISLSENGVVEKSITI